MSFINYSSKPSWQFPHAEALSSGDEETQLCKNPINSLYCRKRGRQTESYRTPLHDN